MLYLLKTFIFHSSHTPSGNSLIGTFIHKPHHSNHIKHLWDQNYRVPICLCLTDLVDFGQYFVGSTSVHPPLVTTEAAVLMVLMSIHVPVTLDSLAPSVKQVRQ